MPKVGDRYIIEIEDVMEDNFCKIKGFLGFYLRDERFKHFEKYEAVSFRIEPETAYERGLKEAWEFARKVRGVLSFKDAEECFGIDIGGKTGKEICEEIFSRDIQELIEKYKAYGERRETENHTMTLDEAIVHAEEKSGCDGCGIQHRQLAEWLRELKKFKEEAEKEGDIATGDEVIIKTVV